LASASGRNYVHSKVAGVVIRSYAALETSLPQKTFVYGETGWAGGGRFRPHRTHQNGLSVDFMVPVVNPDGKSVPLPGTALNRFGYDLEFDDRGKIKDFTIDFEAIGEHLCQLDVAARAGSIDIATVIFDPPYLPKLLETPRGAYLKENIRFFQGKAWWRHDEHYHVDFTVPCRPLSK
jgi:penicillin-insensitive murein endopeptidase